MTFRFVFLVLLSLQLISSIQSNGSVYVQFSSDLTPTVRDRLEFLLQNVSTTPLNIIAPTTSLNPATLPTGSISISFGNTTQTNMYISSEELSSAGPEGYVLKTRAQINNAAGYVSVFACDGNSQVNGQPFTVYANVGLHYCSYAILELLGYGFLHPLQPLIPSSFKAINPTTNDANLNITESPYWPIRGFHYHTEHPLELCECLNGMNSNGTEWEDMVPEVGLYYEWLVANKQNRLEWVLLWTADWNEEAFSPLRQQRLSTLISLGHQWGIAIGADVPIAERQQHAWFMTGPLPDLQEQTEQIQRHVDWLMAANYDYISTESGYSEFTHPNCTLMLEWMNITTAYVMDNFVNKRIYIKCHCSSGQVCDEYIDPYTNEPVNFNFLPAFADPDLGVYAHTVQVYSFFQPAPSYGNTNFTYMLEFLLQQSTQREALFHGETAYWVNYDIDVPLFLPIYGSNRLKDMRTIAKYEKIYDVKTLGQIDFTSGWEWAYWFGDVLTARAAWDPLMEIEDDTEAFKAALMPILHTFGDSQTIQEIVDVLVDIVTKEEELLINGNWNGTAPSDIEKRNGIAYIEGWDSWAEFSSIVDQTDCVQPIRLTFSELRPFHILNQTKFDNPDYQTEIMPLLNAMQSNFTLFTNRLQSITPSVNEDALFLFSELVDSMNITALRSLEVYSLYQYVWGHYHETPQWRNQEIANANNAITQAQEVVSRREAQYRVPVDRIAGWRENPTCYHYGYLWPVHSLYYFWRDYSQATTVTLETAFPCFMNVINPADVGFGDGVLLNATTALQDFLYQDGLDLLAECLSYPPSEPVYPITPIINP